MTVQVSISHESRDLYLEAARLLEAAGRPLPFEFIVREPVPTAEIPISEEAREWIALDRGRMTLQAIRQHLRSTGQDDPKRQYWREAQRRHRAMSRG